MARVDITLNGRPYALACEDGQEPRLRELAAYVDTRVTDIAGEAFGGSEAQLLVLTTLVLADEIFDLKKEAEGLKRSRDLVSPDPAATDAEEERVATAMESLARRIEDIAQRLERA